MNTKKLPIHTHVVAIHPDWDLRSTWKMIKPNLYVDDSGKMQSRPLERQPDGEPTHWDVVLIRGDKSYQRNSQEDCNCDLSSGEMCPHWRELV